MEKSVVDMLKSACIVFDTAFIILSSQKDDIYKT